MSENKRSHRHHGEQDPNGDHESRPPYWRRVHRDWKFWVALSLMLAAMAIYVMSDDLGIPASPPIAAADVRRHGEIAHPILSSAFLRTWRAASTTSHKRSTILSLGKGRKQTMNQIPMYPLRFGPIYEYRLWGGRRFATLTERTASG